MLRHIFRTNIAQPALTIPRTAARKTYDENKKKKTYHTNKNNKKK